MRFVFFYHSLISDWNHDNAHFLRGIAKELQSRGHQVSVYEPSTGWSLQNLIREQGAAAITEFTRSFPKLQANLYTLARLDLDEVLDEADVVIVHEWTDHDLVKRLGEHRVKNNYRLLFHDTHHRSITDPASLSKYVLGNYDGILACGEIIRECYSRSGWGRRAWNWHEAADTTLFRPVPPDVQAGDIVWIGTWGDEERAAEIDDYFVRPVNTIGLRADVYGARYPQDAVKRLERASIAYRGWLPNHRIPETLCRYGLTLNISRRWYVQAMPGIPSIGMYEAMACAVPLVSSYWNDAEGLFKAGHDFLMARDSNEMTNHLRDLMNDRELAQSLGEAGLNSILSRHTCGHRVDELFAILREIDEPLIRESGVGHS